MGGDGGASSSSASTGGNGGEAPILCNNNGVRDDGEQCDGSDFGDATCETFGLSVFLPTGGVTAAALVSTVSYTSVFIATLVAYKAVSGIPWRGLLPTPRRLRALADRAQ